MTDETIESKPNASYPYYYLWHLAAIGIIELEIPTNDSRTLKEQSSGSLDKEVCPRIKDTLWDRLYNFNQSVTQARIAMIDVGASLNHPNLKNRISEQHSIDFAAHPNGAKYDKDDDVTESPARESEANYFSNLNVSDITLHGLHEDDQAFFSAYAAELKDSRGVRRRFGNIDDRFASHGTAMAGLIIGGPADNADKDERKEKAGSASSLEDQVLPYFGVDPCSELISIRASFDNDPFQFIAALLYAWMHGADVIVIPRSVPDPTRDALSAKTDFLAALEDFKNRDQRDLLDRMEVLGKKENKSDPKSAFLSSSSKRGWEIVRALLIEISKSIPIVCATGNDGESQLSYPASLADRDNGIIAVGAVSAEGYRSGYSNYGDGLTLVAPSNDVEVYNRHQVRIDWSTPEARNGRVPVPDTAMTIPLSPLGLLSTDLPGQYGYDGDGQINQSSPDTRMDEDDPTDEGYYTVFGGTSGASALVTGVISLIRRAELLQDPTGKSKRDGVAVKELLIKTASVAAPVFPGGAHLSTDRMNSEDEEVNALTYFFGSGLVSARDSVEAVLPDLYSD